MTAAGLTVKELWQSVLPRETELIAGGGGLDRRVEWATALRTRPPAFDSIKGGEMAFIPVSRIRVVDRSLDLAKVMSLLAQRGGVAVAVVGDVSAESIDIADRMMLPLLRLPQDVTLSEVQESAVRHILERRTQMDERDQELRVGLMGLALGGSEPSLIIDRLVQICGAGEIAASWHDRSGAVVHRGGGLEVSDAELATDFEAVRQWADRTPMQAAEPPVNSAPLGAYTRCVSPVPVRDEVGGFVAVVSPDGHLARLAAMRGAAACAVDLERKRAVTAVRDDIEGEFVSAVITGSYASDDSIAERAARAGFDAGVDHVVVLVQTPGNLDVVVPAVKKWIERKAAGGLLAQRQHNLCLVLPLPGEPGHIKALADDLHAGLEAAAPGRDVVVAAGRRQTGVAGVKVSYREAEQALGLSARLYGPHRAISFDDLGLHRLLFSLRDSPDLRSFHHDHLGTLVDYDEKHNAGLVKTLEAYFECHGSPTEIAQRLSLHRNTVLYRLRRIEEIAGVSLDDAGARLNLHLSLRVADVL
jgi:PucR family transcriptional regulator, purine catabolism regulatory protein